MDLSCPVFTMRSRRAVPFLTPTMAHYPKQLLLYDPRPPRTHLKSTLLEVFILKPLKVPLKSPLLQNRGGGYRLWLTKFYKKVHFAPWALFSTTYGNPILQLSSFQSYAGMGGTPPSSLLPISELSLRNRRTLSPIFHFHFSIFRSSHSGNALASIPGTSFSAFL
jgi:hypothetical protein